MSTTVASTALGKAVPTTAFAIACLTVLYLAGMEQGALTGGTPLLHEVFHDARHLLGLPCH